MYHKTNLIPFWNTEGKYGLGDSEQWQNKIKAMCNIRSDHLYVNFFCDCKVQPYTKMIITFPFNRPFNRYTIQLNLMTMKKNKDYKKLSV